MYSIVEVMYGVPIRRDAQAEVEALGLELEDIDVESFYNGGGDEAPAFCGVILGEFDEATDMALPVSSIRHTPTKAEIAKAKAKIAALPPTVRAKIKDTEQTYYVFCSS